MNWIFKMNGFSIFQNTRFLYAGIFSLLMPCAVFSSQLGETTYQVACKNCHAPHLAKAIQAPAAFDKKAWDVRFKTAEDASKNNPKRYSSAMQYLLIHIKMGKGLMHHGGLCHESNIPDQDCSDQALSEAILYMSQHSSIKKMEKEKL